MRRTLAITLLTLRAAFRYRLVLVLSVILIAGVALLPAMIKDDGTARGFTQIILTYTLSLTTALLGFATLWLSCGILAREIEESQMQMVAVKPIARWQIWLGKWLGILALNAMLLTISGLAIYGIMQWRAGKLPEKQQAILRSEVLVSRKAAREPIPDYQNEADQIMKERLQEGPPPEGLDPRMVRQIITERVKSQYQLIAPGYMRVWDIDLGDPKDLKGLRMYLRVKFDPPTPGLEQRYPTYWDIGDLSSNNHISTNLILTAETYNEFEIPKNLFDAEGVLHIRFQNHTEGPLIFPLEDGMEVLYRTGGFGLNFVRGLAIIFCWLALLAALGLSAASFLSFPVAAFCTVAVLFTVLSSGTLKQIVDEGGIMAVDPNTGYASQANFLNQLTVPLAKGLLGTFNLAREFSPVDSLSSGRAITWGELGAAFFQICILLSGFLALIGILIFNRRELATAQSQ